MSFTVNNKVTWAHTCGTDDLVVVVVVEGTGKQRHERPRLVENWIVPGSSWTPQGVRFDELLQNSIGEVVLHKNSPPRWNLAPEAILSILSIFSTFPRTFSIYLKFTSLSKLTYHFTSCQVRWARLQLDQWSCAPQNSLYFLLVELVSQSKSLGKSTFSIFSMFPRSLLHQLEAFFHEYSSSHCSNFDNNLIS